MLTSFLERIQSLIASSICTKNMTLFAMVGQLNESPVLPIQHFRMALRMLSAPADLVERLMKGSGLGPKDLENPNLEMPASAIWPICDNVAEIFGEDWFLKLPILWSTDTHSELGMAMRFAPDFGAGIDIATEFSHVRWPVIRLSRSVDPNNIVMTLKPAVLASPQNWRLAMCIGGLAFQTVARAILSHGSELIRYQFEGPAPFYAEHLSALFEDNASWGHARMSIIVPKALCTQVSPLANSTSFAALLGALRKLATQQGHPRSNFAAQVSQTLDGVTRGRIDATEVARKIGISKRTLERRLLEEGASFRDLSNESYKKRLEHLLIDQRLTADAIAERMGYHDASSLLRASRRLYGISLSQLRRKVRAEPAKAGSFSVDSIP